MKEIGKVIAVDGNLATVEIMRSSACDGCHKQTNPGGCSACSLLGGDAKMRTVAYNIAHASVGDSVEVTTSSMRMIGYSFLLFVAPIILGLLGYFFAVNFSDDDITRTWFAIAFFVVGVIAVAIYSFAVSKKRCDLSITKIINKD